MTRGNISCYSLTLQISTNAPRIQTIVIELTANVSTLRATTNASVMSVIRAMTLDDTVKVRTYKYINIDMS